MIYAAEMDGVENVFIILQNCIFFVLLFQFIKLHEWRSIFLGDEIGVSCNGDCWSGDSSDFMNTCSILIQVVTFVCMLLLEQS